MISGVSVADLSRTSLLVPGTADRVMTPGILATLPAAALAWGLLILLPAAHFDLQICGGRATAAGDRIAQTVAADLAGLRAGAALPEWVLMVMAMMLPLIAADAGAIASRVYRRSRAGVAAVYTGSYLAVWCLAGPAAIAATFVVRAVLQTTTGSLAPFVARLMAAFWLAVRRRRVWQVRGHFRPVTAPGGRAALCDAARAGLGRAGFCLLSCLPLMILMQAAGTGLAGMGVLAVMLIAEQRAARPDITGGVRMLVFFGLCFSLI